MNKIVLFGFAALTLSLGAEEVVAAQDANEMNISDNCCPVPACPCPPKIIECSKPCPEREPRCALILCSAVPESSNGWYFFADALYWHADVGGSDYAFKNKNTAAPVISGPNHSLDFKWSWGFRLGIGANIDYDQWDTNFYYTWFQTQNSNATGTSAGQLAVDNIGQVTTFSQGKIDWRIHFSMLDWELGRWFYVSKHLSLRPHVGVKGGWINQKIEKEFTSAETSWDVHVKNDFWGVGASGGLNTTWEFAQYERNNFTFFGDVAGAIMYGHFEVDNSELTSAGGGFKPHDLNRNLAVPMLQAILGFGWDRDFNCNRCHVGIRLGYEFQYWFRQNQTLINETTVGGQTVRYQRAHDDLAFQGLTLDLRFDF